MKISCPVCHRNYEIEDQYVGQQFDCPSCKTRFTAGVIVPAQPIEVKTSKHKTIISNVLSFLLDSIFFLKN